MNSFGISVIFKNNIFILLKSNIKPYILKLFFKTD